ncbi:MAG: hypothetical protein ACI4HQ_06335 [Acetatifactor sp.]
MPLMDEFKEEREAVKKGTPKQKLAYFWDYYKWYVVVGICAVIILIATVHDIVSRKDVAFYACMLNLKSEYMDDSSTESVKSFAEYAGIDTETYDVRLDTSIQLGERSDVAASATQKLIAYIASSEVDVIVTDIDSILDFAYFGYFQDLRTFLSPEQFDAYRDSFYYVDNAIVEEAKAARQSNDLDYETVYSDPFKPEDMKDPVPVGIILNENSILKKEYSFGDKTGVVSAVRNSKRPDLSRSFLDFAMQ